MDFVSNVTQESKIMKKLLILILILSIAISISGCKTEKSSTENLKIVTTIFPAYDFAKQICGDLADVNMLLKPGMESHAYDPTARDIINIKNADIFIYTGGESESWANEILSSVDKEKTTIISMLDVVNTPIEKDTHEHNHNHVKFDEHVWTSPKKAIDITKSISNAVISSDSKNKDIYAENTNKYIKKLQELDEAFAEIEFKKPLIIGDRFPFSYLADDYDIEYYSAFPGCSEETEPGAKTMAELIEKIQTNNISTVFYIEFSNQRIANTISEATGCKKLMLHSCHNLSKEDFENQKTYLQLMHENLNNIKEAQK